MKECETELLQNEPPGSQSADSLPQRRPWQAPRGEIVEVAVATRFAGGLGGDGVACHS